MTLNNSFQTAAVHLRKKLKRGKYPVRWMFSFVPGECREKCSGKEIQRNDFRLFRRSLNGHNSALFHNEIPHDFYLMIVHQHRRMADAGQFDDVGLCAAQLHLRRRFSR